MIVYQLVTSSKSVSNIINAILQNRQCLCLLQRKLDSLFRYSEVIVNTRVVMVG